MDFTGKRVLVTGAARRIGLEVALAFARRGADIIAHYHRSRHEAEDLARRIVSMGGSCLLTSHDLTDAGSAEEWMRSLIRQSGGIDILVNSASEYLEGDYSSLDAETLGRSMAIHLLSPAAMIRVMHQEGKEGCAVNILDTRIADRDPNHTAYHHAKRSLHTLTRDFASEMAPLLRVNAVAPGLILPPPGMDEARVQALKSSNPMGEWGCPEDVADAVLYLAGARFVTGQVIFVDGGRHLKGNRYGL